MNALVTGGGGFLGAALVRALIARGDRVRTLARGDYPGLRDLGAETLRGDVCDAAAVAEACRGRDVVFHTAALAGGAGDPATYEAINVGGTENVLAGCAAAGVRALVHTSSPSVVVGDADIEGADESLPYARRFLADYPRTKAEAEQRVLTSKVPAIALRPHLIWGPGDRHLLPRLVARARSGKLRRVGRRDVLVDTTFIDNCVDAHLLAADRLLAGGRLSGRVYFISDGSPVPVWWMVEGLLEACGAPPPRGTVPVWVAALAGSVLESAHAILGLAGEPAITRFAVQQLAHHQWFDISAARRDLGYAPRVSVGEGLARVRSSFMENG